MKILILHDFFSAKGGAENLVLTLFQSLKKQHQVTLVTGYVNEELFPELTKLTDVIRLGGVSRRVGWESLKMLWLFRRRTSLVQDYDVCIYSGIYSVVAAFNQTRQQFGIHYCNTPPRFVYDLKDYYRARASYWQRPLLALLRYTVGRQYTRAIDRMGRVVANSRNIQSRLSRYLGRDSTVIYPPVDTQEFFWRGQGDYYLSTARLEAYKRVDLIVRAFLQLPDQKLVIASSGREEGPLRRLAQGANNITFTGWCSREELADLVSGCIATIYVPVAEDFGISPVESMAAGKPVIAVAEGGPKETVLPGRTGVLIGPDPAPEDLIRAVRSMAPEAALGMRKDCEARAAAYSSEGFKGRMISLVEARELNAP